MESAAPVPEVAEDSRHYPRTRSTEDVPMVIDEGGDTVNIQQSSPATCSPTKFVTPMSWMWPRGLRKSN
jgi:hypothetical protein